MLVEMRHYAEALTRAAEPGHENAALRNCLGTGYINTGSPEEAVKSYERALKLKSACAAARAKIVALLSGGRAE